MLEELDDRYGEPPKSAKALIDVSLIRVDAAKVGIYEINQRKDDLTLYSDAISAVTAPPLVRLIGPRAAFHPGSKPYLTVKIKTGETPLDVLRFTLDKIIELRDRLV